MRTRFFRSRQLELFFQSPRVVTTRGLFFDLILGLEGSIDPESGMIVNLVEVDRIVGRLSALLQSRAWSDEEEILRDSVGLLDSLFSKVTPAHWVEVSLRRDGSVWTLSASEREGLLVSRTEIVEAVDGTRSREKVIETVFQGGDLILRSERRPGGSVKISRT